VQKEGEYAGDADVDGAALHLPESHQYDGSSGGGDDADNFEDLGAELFVDMPVVPKARLGAACVRQDAVEIANGA
jgi:hypothetical protein